MCGRYTLTTSVADLEAIFEATAAAVGPLVARYNVAPTQQVPVVRLSPATGRRELVQLRWGLVPHWAGGASMGARMINARAETLAAKPAFRDAFRRRRCLVVADGFYEWKRSGPRKQPFLVRMADARPFAFAGLWERWQGPDGPVESCTIVTTTANELVASLHDRMPVILAAEHWSAWLDSGTDAGALAGMLRAPAAGAMTARPVSAAVNSPRNDGPECIAPP